MSNPAAAAGGTSDPRQAVDPADAVALQGLAKALESSATVKEGLVKARPHDAIFLGTAESTVQFGDVRPPVGTPSDIVLLDVTVKLSALVSHFRPIDPVGTSFAVKERLHLADNVHVNNRRPADSHRPGRR